MDNYSIVKCSILIKFFSSNNDIYRFEDSWNFVIDKYKFTKVDDLNVKIEFNYNEKLYDVKNKKISIAKIPGSSGEIFLNELDNVTSLVDLISLHVSQPLEIIYDSLEFSAETGATLAPKNDHTVKISDIDNILSRYNNLLNKNNVRNSIRFFRLSKIDNDLNGKGIKLWATLEGLYSGFEKGNKPIFNNVSKDHYTELCKLIDGFNEISHEDRETLKKVIKDIKQFSKKQLLANKLDLMNEKGTLSKEEIEDLLDWWSSSRNLPAHGTRVKPMDDKAEDVIDDMEDTVTNVLFSSIKPPMYGYFLGDPADFKNKENQDNKTFLDYTKDCVAKKHYKDCVSWPTAWNDKDYLIKNVVFSKYGKNRPLLFITHDEVLNIEKNLTMSQEDIKKIPKRYQKVIVVLKEKLNK